MASNGCASGRTAPAQAWSPSASREHPPANWLLGREVWVDASGGATSCIVPITYIVGRYKSQRRSASFSLKQDLDGVIDDSYRFIARHSRQEFDTQHSIADPSSIVTVHHIDRLHRNLSLTASPSGQRVTLAARFDHSVYLPYCTNHHHPPPTPQAFICCIVHSATYYREHT